MRNFTTVTITETEAHGGNNYISATGTAMCRSPKSAWRIAQRLVNLKLAAQSPIGGVPIWRVETVNGVETVR